MAVLFGLQTIALTGDVTGTGATSIATVIGAGKVTNTMLAGSIAYSKLSLTGAILNADLAGSIAYSKLSLTGAILNADLAGSIAYSKLSLTGAILNADLAGSIADSKLASVYILGDGTRALTGNWGMGAFKATSTQTAATAATVVFAFEGINTTAATSGNQMLGGYYLSEGRGFGTTAGTSQAVAYRWGTLPVQSTVPTGTWQLQSSIAGGAFTDRLTVDSAGTVTTTGAVNGGLFKSTNAGSTAVFQGNASNGLQIYNTGNSNRSWIFASSQSPDKMGFGNNTTPDSTIDVLVLALNSTQLITAGVQVSNTTAAIVSQNQISPFYAYKAAAWKTNATAGSELIIMRHYLVTLTGAADPTGYITYESNVNAGSYATTLFTIGSGGTLGIGQAPLSGAYLSIKAGTTTIAPLILTSGTNNTTAQAGAFEYNGTNLFFTRTGTTREGVLVGLVGGSAPSTTALTAFVNYYGTGGTIALSTPNTWFTVVGSDGNTYKIPGYS